MADTLIEENVGEKQPEVAVASNPFSEESWVKDLPVNTETIEKKSEEKPVEEKKEEISLTEIKQEEKPVVEVTKEEIKSPKPEPFKYANETSEKIHKSLLEGKDDDVYKYLDQKKKLDRLTTVEVNKSTAAEIVKLGIQSKYPDLESDEIEYEFKKQFGVSKEPVQGVSEDNEDFEERHNEWKEKVQDAERSLMIEAKKVRPELEKLKTELKLPEITQTESQQKKELSPEELDKARKYVDNYLQSAQASINSFEGFNVEYKDEEASIQSSYIPSIEEKKIVAAQLKHFEENDFNTNALFADKWLNEDGTVNTQQLTKDLSLLNNADKVMQKLVNDGVAKRLAEYRKSTSKINVDGKSNGTFQPQSDKSEMDKLAEVMFAK